ncbi:transcriptional regulator, AraC family [Desulfatibacillum aliphaticivorans]|uniref:Transcriptional regulator, AraC family n=1 Tax=Desulfatibacillum aliphaticivorans TaxID=218208 RepID=B8FN17_DESAL|nr:AraC family transcriptional regulator [Desulfatibacillum aliphaticivorans]ACL05887.1 transcriptional regulator, AraC family [Desulfatibacillum aliphaticivorans]
MSDARAYYEERIIRVQMFIQDHLDDPMTLEELAKVACFSPFHFHRIFTAMTGEPLKEYIRRLLLERAAHELRYSSQPVVQVALNAGYQTHEAFTRAFRNMFGVPPRQYRTELPSRARNKAGSPQVFNLRILKPKGDAMDIRIEEFPPLDVVFIRHTGPYEECGIAWEKLCSHPDVAKELGPETQAIGICYDDPDITEADKIRMDVCVTAPPSLSPPEGMEKQTIKGGEYAVLTHHGPYEGLHDCYRWLFGEWLPSSGREANYAPSLEVYVNSPEEVAPQDLITEIRVPLK